MSKTINSIHAGTTNIRVSYRNNGLSFNNNDHNITVNKAAGNVTDIPADLSPNCGSGNPLCTSGSGTGTMMYRLGTSGNYTNVIPVATNINPGTYTLYYYADSSSDYNSTYNAANPTYITVHVQQLGGYVSIDPTATSGLKYGDSDYLCTAGSGTGTIMYKVDNGSYSSNRPTATGLGAGEHVVYYYAAANGCYGSTESQPGYIQVNIDKATQSAPTATGNSSTYDTSGSISGSASGGGGQGTLYYKVDTSGGTSYGSETTTAPSRSRTSVGTTTFVAYWSGNSNYYASGYSNQASLVIDKASNQITITPTTKTIYSTSGYNSFTITVSNYKGTVTASSSNTGKEATVTKVDNGTFTVTYAGAGSATITISDNGGTNYTSSSATCTVTTIADYVTNSDYNSSNSNYTVNVTIGSGLNAGTTEATVSVSGSHTHTYYNLYASGYVTGPYTSTPSDSPSWSITSQYINSSGNTITRFSKSGNTLSHSSMGATTGTDYVTITANNNGTTKTASANVKNEITNRDYNASNSNYTVSVSIGSGLNCGASEATVSVSGSHTHTYYYLYTSGSTSGPYTSTPSDSPSWSITSQYINSSGNTITRFSKSGNTLSHSSMGATTGTDYVTITANNNGTTKTASTNVTNSVTNSDYNASNSNYTVNVSIGSGLNAGASSATVSVSGSHTHTYYYLYCSGSTSGPYTSTPSDTPTWSVTSQYINSSGNTITRFSKSGNTLSHSSMGATTGTDYVTITANNNGATKTASISVTNSLGAQHYKNTSGTTGDNWTYGTPTESSITIGSGLSAAGGSAALSCSTKDTKTYYRKYDSGTYTSLYTENPASSITWTISSQSCAGGTNRYSVSGSTLSHTTMGTNVGTDSVTVQAANTNSTSLKATKSTSVTNAVTNSNYNPSGYTVSVSIGNGLGPGATSATVTVSASHSAYNYYTSGSSDSTTHTVTDSATWSITSQTFNTSTTITRFSKSGNTLSHSSMEATVGTDKVTITATNSSNTSTTQTATKEVTNSKDSTNYSPSDYTVSVNFNPDNLNAGGGTATVVASASHKAYDHYASGYSNNQHTVTDSATWDITTQTFTPSGGSASTITRFSKSSNTLSHSSMTSNVGTDYIKVTATNSSHTSTTAIKEKSITNSLGSQKYKNTSGTTGYNITYNTPGAVTIGSGMSAAGGSATVSIAAFTNSTDWYQKYDSGTYTGKQTGTEAGSATWNITTQTFTPSGGSASNITRFSKSSNTLSHSSMTSNVGTDYVVVTAVNSGDSTKTSSANKSISNSIITTQKYKNTSGTTGYNVVYVAPQTCTISSSLTAAGGTFYVTCAVTNNTNWYYKYDSGSYTSQQTGTEAGTAKWQITSNGNSRFSNPSSGGATVGSYTLYPSGSSYPGSHSNMTTNVTTDSVTVTAYNVGDTSKTKTASASVTNTLTWSNPVLTVSSPTTPYSMAVSGETKAITASATQSGSYTSGSTASATPDITYEVKTAVTGYSLSSNSVTVTNNTSTSARNGFVVTVKASKNSKTATSDRTFNQAAGSKSYGTPSITAYTYASFPASGDTKSPASVTYTQTWTWNGVANSGGSITSGGTLAYSTTGTLPSGFSTASDFATSGKVTWANRTTTVGDARSSKSNLLVKVTLNGVTSGNYTCTSCDQVANSLGTQKYKNTSGTEGYNITYVAPSCTLTNNLTAAGGSVTVTCSVTNNTDWYQRYTSGSYTAKQTGTEGGTARWMITSNGNSRFSHPSSGGTSLSGVGTVYNSGTAATHSSMTTNATTDTVGITAYNIGDTSKTSGQKTASATNTKDSTNYSPSNYTVSVSIGNGLTAAGGSATVSASASHKAYDYYTSGSYNNQHNVSDNVTWTITTQTFTPSGGSASTITRFSKSSNTLSHTTMGTNAGTDYVKVTATNSSNTSTTATAEKSITNTKDNTNYSPSDYTVSVSIGDGLICSGGSAKVTASASHLAYDHYTSGSSCNQHRVTDTAKWRITSNGNSRFSNPSSGGSTISAGGSNITVYDSGASVSHSNMTTNNPSGGDVVTVTAYNTTSTSATATASKTITNPITSTNYSPSNYTVSVSIGDGMSAGGGSATVTASASHKAYDLYCSGSYNNQHTVTDSVSWSITGNGNNRFEKSGNKVNHSSMGCNATTDTVTVTAVNESSTTTTTTATKSIVNEITNSNYSPSDYVASISINNKSGLTAGGGSSTVTASASHLAYNYYTSGSYCGQHTVSDSVSWSITSNGGSRFTKSGNTLSHSSMGCTATTDTVEVTAVNGSSTSAKATDTASIVNVITNSNYAPSDYTVSVSIGNGITCAGGSATVTATASHKAYNLYTSGSYCGQHDVADTAKWRITSNGNSRFSHPSSGGSTISAGGSNITVYNSGTSVSHSSMGTSLTIDSVTVTAYNTTSTSATATASKSVTNTVIGVTAKSSSNDNTTHFSYANIGPGDTSASPSLSGGALYTFCSGSTAFDSSGSPSFGGTAVYTRQYTLGTVQNGFSTVNKDTGILTATHRGTTPGAARTSGTVTATLVVKYTNPASVGSGVVTSEAKTSTATCTQGANVLEGITFTVNSKTISYQGTTKGTVTARYTSGSTKDVENNTATSYTDAANPDIVTFTKTS